MPPREDCPTCRRKIEDWHLEWYKTEAPLIYQGLAAMDCPLCRSAVGYRQGRIGPAPPGVPLVRRNVDKAAAWATLQASAAAGLTLQGYLTNDIAGNQYLGYWTAQEIQQADAAAQAKTGGP